LGLTNLFKDWELGTALCVSLRQNVEHIREGACDTMHCYNTFKIQIHLNTINIDHIKFIQH